MGRVEAHLVVNLAHHAMPLKWPPMIDIQPGTTYPAGTRLHWPEHHLSIAVPPSCTAQAGQIYCYIQLEALSLVANLGLHKGTAYLVSGWLDEPFTEDGDRLEPAAPAENRLDVHSRRFASATHAGFKVKVDDPWGNGVSGMLAGPANQKRKLTQLLRRIGGSLRFVHQGAFTDAERRGAILPWLNVDAADGGELFLYIDRHFYLLRDDVMEIVERVAQQAEIEDNPMKERISPRWRVLQEARRLVDRGEWDRAVAEVPARRQGLM